jgi:hypothetical protein
MRNCTIALDGRVVVKDGVLQESLPNDRTTPISAAMPMSDPADYYDMSRIRPEVAAARSTSLGPLRRAGQGGG